MALQRMGSFKKMLSFGSKKDTSGADANPEDRWGGRPLDDATHRHHDETAKALRNAGATHGSKGSVRVWVRVRVRVRVWVRVSPKTP